MKLLADESVEKRVVDSLRHQGFDVLSVAELAPSIPDESVLRLCVKQKRILITNDKDFGELIFLGKGIAKGIILLRFTSEKTLIKINFLISFLNAYKGKIKKHFIVLNENGARIRKI